MFMKLDSSSQNLDSLIEQYNRELMRFYQQNAPRIQPDGEPVEEPEGPVRVAYPAKIISPPNPPDFQEDNRREMRERLEQESAAPVPHPSQSNASTPAQPLPQAGRPVSKSFPIHLEDRILEEGLLPGVPLVEEPGALEKPMPAENSEQTPQQIFTPQTPESSPEEGPAVLPEELSLPMSTGYLQVFLSSAREATPIPGAIVTVTRVNGGGEELYAHTTTDRDGLTEVIALPAVDSALTMEPGIPSPYTSYNIQAAAPGYFRVLNVNAPIYGGNTAVQPVQMIPIPEFELSPQDLVFFQTGPQDL